MTLKSCSPVFSDPLDFSSFPSLSEEISYFQGLDIKSSEITEVEICTNEKSKLTIISNFTLILPVFWPTNHFVSLVLFCVFALF